MATPTETARKKSKASQGSNLVIYLRPKGWLSGGAREDIPLQHVTSVRLDTCRRALGAIILLLIGLIMTFSSGPLRVPGALLFALGVLLVWGWPSVVVNTAGRDLNASKGWPWQRAEANEFVEALRNQIFNRVQRCLRRRRRRGVRFHHLADRGRRIFFEHACPPTVPIPANSPPQSSQVPGGAHFIDPGTRSA